MKVFKRVNSSGSHHKEKKFPISLMYLYKMMAVP